MVRILIALWLLASTVSADERLSQEKIDKFVHDYDQNRDMHLELQEVLSGIPQEGERYRQEVMELFEVVDENKDGKLAAPEVGKLLSILVSKGKHEL